jgi:hypothetical protein
VAAFAGITDNGALRLCRLRYFRSADQWGFAIYLAGRNSYQVSILMPWNSRGHRSGDDRRRWMTTGGEALAMNSPLCHGERSGTLC